MDTMEQTARGTLREALAEIELRAQSALDGGHKGPWSAEYLRAIAEEIRHLARVALEVPDGS